MMNLKNKEYPKIVQYWLLLGLFMVFMQVVIGGITRLTESGLSITKWEVVTGTLPPMNDIEWQKEFDLYKDTPQYNTINKGMTMSEFKFIYFWEYIHRLWARIMGFVFVIPLGYFIFKGWIDSRLAKRLSIVFILACLAATFGWIMVASGLIERPWVNAYKLSIHLMIAFSVYVSILWSYLYSRSDSSVGKVIGTRLVNLTLVLLGVQIFFGGVIAGMKAALVYPSWPAIGNEYIPSILFNYENWSYENFNNYDKNIFLATLIHFLHRTTAYLLLIVGLYLSFKLVNKNNRIVKNIGIVFGISLLLQLFLGIITVLKSVGNIPVLWGVLHQAMALVLLSCLIILLFYNRNPSVKN